MDSEMEMLMDAPLTTPLKEARREKSKSKTDESNKRSREEKQAPPQKKTLRSNGKQTNQSRPENRGRKR